MAEPQRVSVGQKFRPSASMHNQLVGLLNGDRPGLGAAGILSGFSSSGIVRVKNSSGGARSQYEILGLGSPVITPTASLGNFKQQILLDGTTPAANGHTGKFGILLEPLSSNAIGLAVVDGLAICQIEVVHEWHRYADVTDASAVKLTSNFVGAAEILYAESGTGTKWAVVRIGIQPGVSLRGKANATIAKGASGTINIYDGAAGSEVTTGATISAYAKVAAISSTSVFVTVEFFPDEPGYPWRAYVNPWECA